MGGWCGADIKIKLCLCSDSTASNEPSRRLREVLQSRRRHSAGWTLLRYYAKQALNPDAKVRSFNSVLNVKALVGAFNQENALVGAYSVIVKLRVIFGNLRLKL